MKILLSAGVVALSAAILICGVATVEGKDRQFSPQPGLESPCRVNITISSESCFIQGKLYPKPREMLKQVKLRTERTLPATLTWRCYEAETVVTVRMVLTVKMDKMGTMVTMVVMAVMVSQAGTARMARRERRETKEIRETVANVDLLAPAVEGWCTLAGDGQPAPTHQEQSWSMQEGLGGLIIIPKGEELTTSACQKPQTTCSSHLESKKEALSMGQSINPQVPWHLLPIIIRRAQCVEPLVETRC